MSTCLRFVNVHEQLTLGSEPEVLESPLLPQHKVPGRIAHGGIMHNPPIVHAEVVLQDLIHLPALHLHAQLVLQLPAHIDGRSNVIRLLDHLLNYLPDGRSPVAL